MKADFKAKIAVAALISSAMSIVMIARMYWAHPDVQVYSSLQNLENINNLLNKQYSNVDWFELGSGHAMTLYMLFQYITALFFHFDSRIEYIVLAISTVLTALSIIILLRGLIAQLNPKFQTLIMVLVPASMFSFLGMGSRGMELGIFLGVAITLSIWAFSSTSIFPKSIWVSALILQVLTVFGALGAYSMGISGSALLVGSIFYCQEVKDAGGKILALKNIIKMRFVQFSIALSASSLAHVLAVLIYSTPSSNVVNNRSDYSITELATSVINANAQPLLNTSVNERWGSNWTQVDTLVLGVLMTILYLFLTFFYLRKGSAASNFLIGLVWYGTFVSLTVYPFRPYGSNWMSNIWYTFHYKISFAAAIVGIIGLVFRQVNTRILWIAKASVLVSISVIFSQSNVIMWERHPHERLWFLSKKEATLHPELLVLESNGLTQIGLDMQSSGRAIEIQKKHNLSVFNQYEE